MPRPADKIFLRIATTEGYLSEEDADGIWGELSRLERAGQPTKARKLAVEFGFMSRELSRQVKQGVREYLTERVREESVSSRNDRRVAGFELLERLGSGAMGTVFKARHQRLDKLVALKILNPTFAADERYVARFLLEARAAASLNHPNMVQAYDVGQAGDVHFIAMEYVDGKTVKELIDRRGFLDEAASVEIVLQVLSALQHAHENHLIHRDVKPANIMITADGHAKLLDLGLARRTDVENGLTGEGKAIGTPYFMAPEQALDKGADYRADLYALGATLFNMVTGQKPYKAGTPVAVMNMHLKAPIPDATQINDKVSSGMSRVIKKMLGKRPAERYQHHDALKADLEAVLSGFMPDLQGGKAPEGISFIRPRKPAGGEGGTRTQREAVKASAGVRGLQVGVAIVAFIVVAIIVGIGSKPKTPQIESDDGLVADSTDDDGVEEAATERAARRLYAELTRGRNWQRVEELEELSKSYGETVIGRKALREAQALRGELSTREVDRFDDRTEELDALARDGQLQAAFEGYRALARQVEDASLREKAQQRADALRVDIDEQLTAMRTQATELEGSGREREAAAVLRKTAKLQPKVKRRDTLARADQLDERATERAKSAVAGAKSARASEAKEEAQAVKELPGRLRRLVRNDALVDAFEFAKDAGQRFQDPENRKMARAHAAALKAGLSLAGLSLDAFAELQGKDVRLERKRAGPLVGKLKKAVGDKLTVSLSKLAGAEVTVSVDDLAEEEIWRAVRRLLGAKNETYLLGVTAIKLYREDADLDSYLERCQDANIDLSAVIQSLQESDSQGAVVAGAERGKAIAVDASVKKPKSVAEQREEALRRNKAERWLIANRLKVFADADVVGYAPGRLEPSYNFQENTDFRKDWRRVRGESRIPAAGAVQERGLILEGNGRADFVAPLVGDLAVKVRFTSKMMDSRYGRFAIVLEGEKGQRASNELGQLRYLIKNKLRAREGEQQNSKLRQGTVNTFELLRDGNVLTAKINGTQSTLTLPKDLGVYRLSIEWNKSALNLVHIRCMLTPEPRWVQRIVGDGS